MNMSQSLPKPPFLSAKRKFLSRLFASFLIFSMSSAVSSFNPKEIQVAKAATSSHLLISEALYDTPGTDSDEEWIEIYNPTGSTVDISDYKVGDEEAQGGSEGMFEFPDGATLEAGARITVALKATGFNSLYGKDPDFEVIETSATVPNMIKYSPWGTGSTISLANTGDEILLLNASDNPVDVVTYESGFYTGVIPHPGVSTGHSIERVSENQDTDDCSVDFQDQAIPNPGASTAPPENKPPLANPGGLYTSSEGSSIQFDGSLSSDPDGDPLTYLWDFGDGVTSNDKNPAHTYLQEGNYSVTLVVNDGKANSDSSISTATVYDTDPVADFTASTTTGIVSFSANFADISTSYDGISSWQWDFDNDGTVDSTDQNPTHVYSNPGAYTVSLTVQEADGDRDIETKTGYINVSPSPNQAPVANAAGPYFGTEGIPVSFDATSSLDPDGGSLIYNWDFGDGVTSTEMNPTHTYTQEGNYTVSLVVNDGKTESDSANTTAIITDLDPEADFTTSETSGEAPLAVSFTDLSTSYDGIIAWEWDFDNDGIIDSTNQNPSHTYQNPGVYAVSLTVSEADGDNHSEVKSRLVTVLAPITTPYEEIWDYVFEDSQSGTELRINTEEKLFQFVTTHKEFPVKKARKMKVRRLDDLTIIRIKYKDCELWIRAVAVLDSEIDFAAAVIHDKKAKKTYLLLDLLGPKN